MRPRERGAICLKASDGGRRRLHMCFDKWQPIANGAIDHRRRHNQAEDAAEDALPTTRFWRFGGEGHADGGATACGAWRQRRRTYPRGSHLEGIGFHHALARRIGGAAQPQGTHAVFQRLFHLFRHLAGRIHRDRFIGPRAAWQRHRLGQHGNQERWIAAHQRRNGGCIPIARAQHGHTDGSQRIRFRVIGRFGQAHIPAQCSQVIQQPHRPWIARRRRHHHARPSWARSLTFTVHRS
jgi:hypothetical protein